MTGIKKIEKQHLLFVSCLFLFSCIFLWRSTLSVNYYDEPYSIAVNWRFFKGGAILAEDWHPSQQLTAWLLYPLYWFWYRVLNGNEGIILAFRVSYIIFQGLIASWCYFRLKDYKYCAVASTLLFVLSTHNNMMTVNYNTIGIGCMMLLLTTLFTEKKFSRTTLMICGCLVSVIVLAQPYSIVIFGLWGISVCIVCLTRRKKKIPELLRFRNYFYIGLGAFLVLLLFIMVVLKRANMEQVLTGIHYNLSDPEHEIDISYKISKYFERFYRYYKYQILVMFASLIVGIIPINDKRVNIVRLECFCLATVAFCYTMISLGWISDYVPIDFISVPMTFLGLSIFGISRKKNWKLLGCWVIPAFMYTFGVQFATDTGILAVSAATIVASAGSTLMLAEAIREEAKYIPNIVVKWLAILIVMLNILQAALFMYQRVFYTWWGDPIEQCTELIEEGPAKGIRTSKEDLEEYKTGLAEIDQLRLSESDRLLILEHATWLYLYADVPVATYSFWAVGEENFLDEYYLLYPEKTPTVVYVWDEDDVYEKDYINKFLEKNYELTEFDSGNVFLRNNK